MHLAYRDFEGTDDDYKLLVDIMNVGAEVTTTVDEAHDVIESWMRDKLWGQQFVLLQGKCIGEASCRGHSSADLQIGFKVLPENSDAGFEEEIYGHLLDRAKSYGANAVTTTSNDDDVRRNAVLTRIGFECVLRSPLTRLDLEHFDAARFAPILRKVEEQGIAIRSVAELKEGGVAWLPGLHAMLCEIDQDVPRVGSNQEPRQSLEELREEYLGPNASVLSNRLVALDGELLVGFTSVYPALGNTEVASTGLTGVIRSYRQRGIATALKVTILERMRHEGVRFVVTGNEENNPMLQLNIKLGFRQVHVVQTYRKVLDQTKAT